MKARHLFRLSAVLLGTFFVSSTVLPAYAGPTPTQKCTSTKEKTTGKHGQCHTGVLSKGVGKATAPDAAKQAKCDEKTTKGFTKAEAKSPGECLTVGDVTAASTDLEQCSVELQTLILNGTDPLAGGAQAKCDSKKIKTAGKYLACVYGTRAKATSKGLIPDFTKCNDKLKKGIDKSNIKGPCSGVDDLDAIQTRADQCAAETVFDGTTPPRSRTYTLDCVVLNVPIALPLEITATPTTPPLMAGAPIDIDLTSTVNISEATAAGLVALLNGLGQPTSSTIEGSTLFTSATAGADTPNPEELTLVGPLFVDLADDTSMPPNGIPGPFSFVPSPVSTTYDVAAAATELEISLDSVSVDITVEVGGMPLTINLAAPGTAECEELPGSPIVFPVLQ